MLEPLEITKFCNDNNISIEELLLLYRILCKKEAKKKDERLRIELEKYANKNRTTHDYQKLVDILVIKELLINNNTKGQYLTDLIIITDNFLNLIYVDKDKCFIEVIEVYPHNINISGSLVPSLTYKGGSALLKEKYFNDILKGGSSILHNKFISVTKEYFKNKQFAQNKLADYIDNFEVFVAMQETKKPNVHDKNRK